MPSARYTSACIFIETLDDAELIELHRYVSRLARAAYGRQPRYQENYRNSVPAAQAKIRAARDKAARDKAARASGIAPE